jgi:catechol 2,3-dioxygenase-like lactoylglutathione lyase family enzyme
MTLVPARAAVDIGIIVADIDRSLDFYVGLLGLEKLEEVSLPFGQMHRLRFGNSFVKLVDAKDRQPNGVAGMLGATGLRYLTFPVSNIDAACDVLMAAGVTFDWPKAELMPGVSVAMFRDPDGNTIELVQRI